jgi:hypothetical protein
VRWETPTAAGTSGAYRVTLFFPDIAREIDFKWKKVPPDGDGVNNAPRKEIAVYAVQKWCLDPADYAVPTSVLRCVPLDAFPERRRVRANIDGTRCRLGNLSVWLKDVSVPDELFDKKRFQQDPVYARYLADFNLLTFLVGHKDGRDGNFLVSKDEARRRVFAVDNGISFDPWIYNYFVPNWHALRVPALRKASIERLRGVTRSDVEALGVLAELRADARGMLRPAQPGPNVDPSVGARVRPGFVQVGLSRREIRELWRRLARLLEDVDGGKVALF